MLTMLFDNLYFVGIFIGALAGQGFFSIYQGHRLVRGTRASRELATWQYRRSVRLGGAFLLFSLVLLLIFSIAGIVLHKSIGAFLIGTALMFLLYAGVQIFIHR